MGFSDYFATVASNFMKRYADMTQGLSGGYFPKHYKIENSELEPLSNTENVTDQPTDEYIPSTDDNNTTPVTVVPDDTEGADVTAVETDNEPVDTVNTDSDKKESGLLSDGNYYFTRRAKLDYKMDLRFDLAALTSIAAQINDGDTTAIEEFAAANFGLGARFSFSGFQKTDTNMIEDADGPASVSKFKQSVAARQVSMFGYQSRNFTVQSFSREALSIRRSSQTIDNNEHRITVNKFSLRYQLDNQFSFAHLSRFNIQTRDVADQAPDSLGSYFESAGNVAEKGSTEMMAAFFDAVDSYLAEIEDKLVADAARFFEMAAEELGFSGEMVEAAKDQFIGTIESFFDRVNSAVDLLQSQFVPSLPPETDVVTEPIDNLVDPALVQDQEQLAIA